MALTSAITVMFVMKINMNYIRYILIDVRGEFDDTRFLSYSAFYDLLFNIIVPTLVFILSYVGFSIRRHLTQKVRPTR
jgi:hypothetical protein